MARITVKRAKATNLKQCLQMHQLQYYATLVLDVQQVIKCCCLLRWTVQNVY